MSAVITPSSPPPVASAGLQRKPTAVNPKGEAPPPPLPARRLDLNVSTQQYQGQKFYLVKDPLTLKYFRFAPAEYQMFELLDGVRTRDEVHVAISRELSLRDIVAEDISKLAQRWQMAGLLQEPGATATSRILATQERARQAKRFGWLSSVMYMKVRAIDPDPILNRIYPWVRWLYSPFGVFLALCSMFSAAVLVAARFEEFTSQPEIQDFHAFFNLQNIFWLWLAVGIVKVLHEFGHGLTCKHFGGECHAMGLLFMCFTPCMYCDVSDSWLLPNKWHRIAIAAAGIYVELLVASLATFVWWSTVPGVLHSVAFSAMLFGSVQTILINANPLMRFDGYYVMSDYLEIPNLRQKSVAFTRYYLKKWFWGTTESPPGSGGLGFVFYAVIKSWYMTLFTISVIWLFTRLLEPYKLAVVGWGLSGMVATNILIMPVARGIVSAMRNPKGFRPQSWWRPLMGACLIAAVAGAFFYAPLPRLAYAVLALEPDQSEGVSNALRGQIVKQFVVAGQQVRKGDPLIELDNKELRQLVDRMEQQRDLRSVQMRTAVAVLNPGRAQSVQVSLKELESQLAEYHRRIENLVLRAPCDGRVVPEPQSPQTVSQSSSTLVPLGGWKRSVLHPENLGATLKEGTSICRIARTEECVAVAVLSQTQIEFVKIGQEAAIKLDAFPGETFLGTVQEVSVQDAEHVAPQLLNIYGSELPAISSGPNAGQLAESHYSVRIKLTGLSRGELTEWPARLRTGLRGRTWIRAGSQTAAEYCWRWFCQVFQW